MTGEVYDMGHAYDPELAGFAAAYPDYGYVDILGDRAAVAAETAAAVPLDETAVGWHDEAVTWSGVTVPVRIYRPEVPGPLRGAAIMHVHAGGWVLGDLDFEHAGNIALVQELGVTVVSVGYRLAPEHRYPASLDDCHAAWNWLSDSAAALGVDAGRLALTGASAGAALCAGVAMRSRDEGGPQARLLVFNDGAFDDRMATASMTGFDDTPVVRRTTVARMWDAYLGPGLRGTDGVPVYAAPARATDLAGLPPTYFAVSQFDPMRDDSLTMANLLLAAGVPTEVHLFPGTFHGSSGFPAEVSDRAWTERLATLRRGLTATP